MFPFRRKNPQAISSPITFGFGDPVKVLDTVDLLGNYLKSYHNGRYFETPVSFEHLYKSQYSNPHHLSAMQFKTNLLCEMFVPSAALDLKNFRVFCQNALTFGNGYLQEIPSMGTGKAYKFQAAPGLFVRRIDERKYGLLQNASSQYANGAAIKDLLPLDGRVHHWIEHDLEQEIYGKPYYMAALQAAWLNEDATLFRRNYFKNGNHAGFILYMSDPAHSLEDVTALKNALKEAKGPGAFRNLFFYAPKGKKDGMQVIPVESAQAQDKFFDIKNVSRDDILAAHRTYPNLLAVQSTNAGGFGNILDAREAFIKNEILPMAKVFSEFHPILKFKLN